MTSQFREPIRLLLQPGIKVCRMIWHYLQTTTSAKWIVELILQIMVVGLLYRLLLQQLWFIYDDDLAAVSAAALSAHLAVLGIALNLYSMMTSLPLCFSALHYCG